MRRFGSSLTTTTLAAVSVLAVVALNAAAPPAAPRVAEAVSVVQFVKTQANSTIVKLDSDALRQAAVLNDEFIIEQFPLAADLMVDVQLQRFEITTPETQFVIGSGDSDALNDFDPADVTLLRGNVVDKPGSHVFLAVSKNSSVGLVDLGQGREHFKITSKSGGGLDLEPDQLAIFETTGGIGPLLGVPICGVDTLEQAEGSSSGTPTSGVGISSTRVIEIAIETDFELYSLFNDAEAAAEYVMQLYGAVSDIYLRDVNVRFELTFVRIWDNENDLFNEPDPLGPFRDYWNANMGAVQRDVAQFFTGRRDLPYGGVAWVSALCGSSAYSVAGFALGRIADLEIPNTGNWDVIVTAHELGHNCGTLHTHSYGIDNCNVGELQRGTIMSYCHTVPGGNANIDLRLHTGIQPFIESHVLEVTCLIEDCNGNGIDDIIDINDGDSADVNSNGVPDECEDCNGNGELDDADIDSGFSDDLNGNGVPDECEPDCNKNGVPDDWDIFVGTSQDLYGNGVPDECEADCNSNGTSDYNEIQADMGLDIDRNAILDSCQDCDDDGEADHEALGGANNLWLASRTQSMLSQCHIASGVVARTSDAGQLNQAQDLVIRADGHVFVSNAPTNRIVEFDVDGNFLGVFVPSGLGGLSGPAGLVFAPNGNLLVASFNTDSVLEYEGATGEFVGQFVAVGAGGLTGPFGLTFGPNGNLFVTSSSNQVYEFDGSSGAIVGVFVSTGDNGGLATPKGLLFKPDGKLLVASFGSDALLEFDGRTGAFVDQWDNGGLNSGYWGLDGPWGLRLGPNGNVYVASHGGNAAVHMYDINNGNFMRSFYVLVAGSVVNPTGLDFVPGGDIDCNLNLIPDSCDITSGTSQDVNGNGIPDECESPGIPGDLDGDGSVGASDLLILLANWGPCADCDDCVADIDGDCSVGASDLLILLANWG
ncbi:MAG: M12 family metallo-peptidase [Phycisphaerales bacterium]